MKKLLFLLLLLPSLSWGQETMVARMNPYVLGAGTVAAASCNTQEDATVEGDEFTVPVGQFNTTLGRSTKFAVDSTYTICAIKFNFQQTGTPGSTLTACVYEDNAGVPGAEVGCSSAVNESVIVAAGGTTYTFSLSAPVSPGNYHIGLMRGAYNNSNYFYWKNKNGYCASCVATYSGSWAANINVQLEYVTYK